MIHDTLLGGVGNSGKGKSPEVGFSDSDGHGLIIAGVAVMNLFSKSVSP
jgi:hypothetical protein